MPSSNQPDPFFGLGSRLLDLPDGRRAYFPRGPSRSGYIVPDPTTVRRIDAAVQATLLGLFCFGGFFILPLRAIFIWINLDGWTWLSMATLIADIGAPIVLGGLIFRLVIRHVTNGLERVAPLTSDATYLRRRGWPTLLGMAALDAVVLLTYPSKLAGLRIPAGSYLYYPSLTWPLIITSVAFLAFLGSIVRPEFLKRRGVPRWIFVAIGLVALVISLQRYVVPIPSITVDRAGLSCPQFLFVRFRSNWTGIVDMRLRYGIWGDAQVIFALAEPPAPGAPQISTYDINGTTTDYRTIYETIRTSWERNR